MSLRRALGALLLALLAAGARADESATTPYALRAEVESFIRELVARHAFDAEELRFVFSRARREDAVLAAMRAQPRQADSWHAYRALFVNERHLRTGLEFWQRHQAALARAQREFGVPEEIIVAIIGIETFYGRNTGRWRVIDALATLAFDYPPRAPFFRGELENYLLFARDMDLDVFSVRGSYAGAIGIPQFMPGSYLRYAVDFDGDGRIDLRDNPTDAIGSVGNFLKQHGWQRGEPVQRAARVAGNAHEALLADGVLPRRTLEELRGSGVQVRGGALPDDRRGVLLRLITPGQPEEFRVGLHNFYVLTRYNRSVFYALSVSDLADQMRAARRARGPAQEGRSPGR